MPDIMKNIEVDEHYTITSDVVELDASKQFLKGAIVGSTFSTLANMPKLVKVPVEATNRTIFLKRAIRDTPTVIVEQEKIVKVNQKIGEIPSKLLVSELKIRTDKKKLEPEYTVPLDPLTKVFGIKKLKSARLLEIEDQEKFGYKATAKDTSKKSIPTIEQTKKLYSEYLEAEKEKKPKKTLGVQRATVFRDAEQISVDRRIQMQKKELRRDLKSEVMKNASMGSIIQAKDSQLKVATAEVNKLKANVSSLNSRLSSTHKEFNALKTDIKLNYVTKLRYQKDITRLQMTLQKYAHMATGISAYQGEFKSGGDVGELVRVRRREQARAIEEIAETRRQGTLGNMFNKMGMKSRRSS